MKIGYLIWDDIRDAENSFKSELIRKYINSSHYKHLWFPLTDDVWNVVFDGPWKHTYEFMAINLKTKIQ